ncbi:TlyA family RNA methyltransferase [Bacillus marinisedimentorum]|uniref:TlyA family RNA methyltransferase n=1 Tax=Bacillus marinisedimentorum TaxID=1821260 RepID=UPI0007E28B04|nr:TlyA family RNA methyltransferase [Bacillus marinisedimentorum]
MRTKKERADVLLVEQGLSETREKAKRAIMAGLVYAGDERIDKPGVKIPADKLLTVKGPVMPYVGRGGLKLEKALSVFEVEVEGKTVIDIGASTGGFTDCALQHGASMSYAIDVGYNQLSWKLRQDERVEVMERTNFRYVTRKELTRGLPDFATIDVSFISLKLILPVLGKLLAPASDIIALVKPQFEAGREEVRKKGIVRDPSVHLRVLEEMISFSKTEGYSVMDLSFSPITGGDGNIEFLLHLKWADEEAVPAELDPRKVVEEAHESLKNKSREQGD